MTLPGISDAERLEELRERLKYARQDFYDAEQDAAEAQAAFDIADQKAADKRLAWQFANDRYVAHLEMMAAWVAK